MLSVMEMLRKYSNRFHHDINRLIEPLRQNFGVYYFHFHKVTNDGKMVCVSSETSYNEYFFSNEISKYNPYMVHPSKINPGLSIATDQTAPGMKETNEYFRKYLNIETVLSLVRHTEDGYVIGAFGVPNSSSAHSMIHEYNLLVKYMGYFQDEGSRFLPDLLYNAVDLVEFMGENFGDPSFVVSSLGLENKEKYLSVIGLSVPRIPKFSGRENECIKLLMEGFTCREIARRLELSHRTVEHYIDQIKSKLGVNKKSEIFRYIFNLIDLGLYSIY